jgi:predicted protein tyrosine phosphatase
MSPERFATAPTQLLFICSRNQIRSLTAEKLMRGVPGYRVASAGTQPGARIVVTGGMIRWANIIVCMEKSHLQKVRKRFPEELEGKRVITLHIPDEYQFMAEDLIDELRTKLAGHIALPD